MAELTKAEIVRDDWKAARPADHGTAEEAITWAIDHNPDGEIEAGAFLRCWMTGDLDEWPEFYLWLSEQPK